MSASRMVLSMRRKYTFRRRRQNGVERRAAKSGLALTLRERTEQMRGERIFRGGFRAQLERRDREPPAAEEAALGEGGGLVQPGDGDAGVDQAAEGGRAKPAQHVVRQEAAPVFIEHRAIGKAGPRASDPAPGESDQPTPV